MMLFPTLLIGQILDPEVYSYDCIEEENNAFVDTTYRGLYESRNGASHSPHGEIRFLVAFVELIYEGTEVEDPSPNGTEQWRPGELPIWKDDLLSPFTPNGISNHHLTKYYQYASSNNHIVLGDYLESSTNNGLFQVNTVTGNIGVSSIIDAINQQLGNSIRTVHDLNSISDFDKWTTVESENNFGTEKSNVGNGKWDYVVFVVRNSIYPPQACGATYYYGTEKELLGFPIDAYTIVCTNDEIPTHIIRHEYAHMLLGGNNMHTAGGGYSSSNYNGKGNYWIPQTGGWGLLGLYGCSLWCWNAWDRQRLGWVDSTSTYEISARNQNGIEVSGDLDATDPNDSGIYVLRDFVTTGDAIRIKLPYIDSGKEYQEWLWIENHQGVDNNDNEFDQWQYQDRECVEDLEPGLMMYIQVNNDTRISDNYKYIYNENYNHADYTRVLTANGLWDRDFLLDSVNNGCVNYDPVRPFVRLFENPFTGTEDQSQYTCDLDNDNKIEWNDFIRTWTEFDDSVYYKNLWQLGHSSHSFNLQGNRKIGMGTNPSTASLINMVGENVPNANAKNLRKTYLNGISVEMLEQLPNGDIKVLVRFDDVDINNDTRWCSDSIVLNPINTSSGYSLNLKSGKTILLDQGLTATRMTDPMVFNDKKIFASPTVFTVMPDADIHLEHSSKIVLDNGSMMHMSDNSSCVVEDSGYIEIKAGTTLQLDDCSSLVINGNGKLIVRTGAELRISPNAVLAFQNGLNNLLIEDGVNIPEGYMHPANIISNTVSNVVIDENTIWNSVNYNVYGNIYVKNEAVLDIRSSSLRFTDKDNRIIIESGGKLIIDNSLLTTGNCSKLWQGIEVWGNSTIHQYTVNGHLYQGVLEMINGATIENAICAVKLYDPSNKQNSGGIIHASDAVFRNNVESVSARDYINYNPVNGNETLYNASFRNCTFTLDAKYTGDEFFYRHVYFDRVNGIKFHGCSFSVNKRVPWVIQECSGIEANSAGFTIDAFCDANILPCPEESLIRSSFTGFHFGIKSSNNGGAARTFSVKNSTFKDNNIGIYAENTGYATILKNDFYVGSNADCNFGIYADNVTGFCIEENNFSGNPLSSDDMYGIVIHNSRNYNNVYLNNFYGLTCGNIAIGDNMEHGLSQQRTSGLSYYCNTNTGNINDFCVIKDNSASVNGIARSQGSSAEAAGNTFSGSQYHFYNDGDDMINYYYSGGKPQEPTNSKLHRVTAISTINGNDCSSHYGNNPVVKSDEEMTSLENDYQTSLSAYNSLEQLYTSRIDGGDTQAELLDINTATADDASRLRSQLLGLSPYLSQEVLTTAASRNDVFSTSTLFEILSANPDELKKDTLISYLENKDNPMPEYMTELLREIANGSTARTALESQMAKSEREYILAAGDIVRSNLNSEESDNEELRLWLGNMNDMASDRLAIATYIQESDFENALALAETLPDVYGLQGIELEEHNDYISILRLYETLDESGRDIMQLTETETEMLEEIADNGSGSSQMMATAIIEQNGVTTGTGYSCPTLPTANNSKRGTANLKSDIASAMGMKADFAPNPATAWTEIDYTLPLDEEKASLVITNALGVNVMTVELDGNQGRKTLYIEQLPAGVYTYFVKCGEYTITGKLMKK